jgi:hypothetical protein
MLAWHRYTDQDNHSPNVYRIQPAGVVPGSIISVEGNFHSNPFAFDKLRAPNQEVPLLSVKGTFCMILFGYCRVSLQFML